MSHGLSMQFDRGLLGLGFILGCAYIPLAAPLPEVDSINALTSRLIHQGTERDALYAIAYDDGRTYAVGAGTGLLSSTSPGGNWSHQDLDEIDFAVFGIALTNDITMLVGQQGKASIRRGESAPWLEMQTGLSERLLNIDAAANGVATVVGGFGSLAVSTDFGSAWKTIETDWESVLNDWFEPHLYDVDVSENQITVVGEFGVVMRSADSGMTWSIQSIGDASLFALDLRADGVGYVVGQDGFVARSEDNGASWTPCLFEGGGNLFGVSSHQDRVIAVGMRSVLVSDDSCQSFAPRSSPVESTGWWQEAVYQPESNRFLAIGSGGRILSLEGT